jgi:hypothetical protein
MHTVLRTRADPGWFSATSPVASNVARVATLDDVARVASGLPEVVEDNHRGGRSWSVAGKAFAWERPFSKADLKRFGVAQPPPEPILAVSVEDLDDKESVLAEQRPGFFTIPHFDGYAAVLIELRKVRKRDLRESIIDGWLARAPRRLTDAYVRPGAGSTGSPKA